MCPTVTTNAEGPERAGSGGKRKEPLSPGALVLSWGYQDLNLGPLPYQGVDLAALVVLNARLPGAQPGVALATPPGLPPLS